MKKTISDTINRSGITVCYDTENNITLEPQFIKIFYMKVIIETSNINKRGE